MSKNKIFFLFIAMLSLVVTACSDDDYKWASAVGEQVYFDNSLGSTVTVSKDTNAVDIPVRRINTKGAATVPLKVTGAESTIYNIPTSVSFADGQSQANISITYNPDQVVYGDYDTLTIALGDSTYSTPYGLSTYEFQIGAEEWEAWHHYNAARTATWYYQFAYSGADQQDFQVRQSIIDPNKYQFRMTHVLNDVTVIFNYDKSTQEFTIDPTYIGEMYQNSQQILISDLNSYYVNVLGRANPHNKGTFDEEQGILDIPVIYYCEAGVYGYGIEEIMIDGFNRADYTTSGAYLGKLTNADGDPTRVYFNVTLGKDVESANVALVQANQLDSTTLAKIIDGSYTPLQQITKSGEVTFDAQNLEDGNYTLVIIPFANNEAQTATASTVRFAYTKGATEWESLGTGKFVDDIVGSLYFEDYKPEDFTFDVEIQASTKTPGMYRLVDPFAGYAQYGSYDSSSKHYIEINAVNPQGVYIEPQQTGLTLSSSDGEIGLESIGYYQLSQGATLDDIIANGLAGTLENGTITFPAKGILAIIGGGAYYANPNGATQIILPSSSKAKKFVASKAKKFHKTSLKAVKVTRHLEVAHSLR